MTVTVQEFRWCISSLYLKTYSWCFQESGWCQWIVARSHKTQRQRKRRRRRAMKRREQKLQKPKGTLRWRRSTFSICCLSSQIFFMPPCSPLSGWEKDRVVWCSLCLPLSWNRPLSTSSSLACSVDRDAQTYIHAHTHTLHTYVIKPQTERTPPPPHTHTHTLLVVKPQTEKTTYTHTLSLLVTKPWTKKEH